VQNHTKRLLITKISDRFKEIVVAESNAYIKIYLRPTLVVMITKIWDLHRTIKLVYVLCHGEKTFKLVVYLEER